MFRCSDDVFPPPNTTETRAVYIGGFPRSFLRDLRRIFPRAKFESERMRSDGLRFMFVQLN